jgi:hypothetical protein
MPLRVRDLTDFNRGNLNGKTVLLYDNAPDKFTLDNADKILSESVADGNIPNVFVEEIQEQINPENLNFYGVDGGVF